MITKQPMALQAAILICSLALSGFAHANTPLNTPIDPFTQYLQDATCKQATEDCEEESECCTELCVGTKCSTCVPVGQILFVCTADANCCSGCCFKDYCREESACENQCVASGEHSYCEHSSECCSECCSGKVCSDSA